MNAEIQQQLFTIALRILVAQLRHLRQKAGSLLSRKTEIIKEKTYNYDWESLPNIEVQRK